MAFKNKYQREKQQYSNDSGRTWIDVSPANYRRGRLIEAGSNDCNTIEWKEVTGSWFCIGFNETQYRWVDSGSYICQGMDKYSVEKKQQSVDGGTTWTDVSPIETQTGSLIEANSTDCGYVPPAPGGYENQYLTFEALQNGTFTFRGKDDESFLTLSYSLDDGQTWTELERRTESPTITTGNKIMWKGTCTPETGNFSSTGTFKVYGNIMSIVHGDDFRNSTAMYNNHFNSLFKGTKVVNAENLVLPSTTLESYCYAHMFSGCSNLTTAPELPATTLANNCYDSMFYDCTSLTTAPELPATTLAENCYAHMFYGCTGLVNAPELPATTLAKSCYYYMFVYCKSLVNAPALTATTLASYCYDGMFIGCTSLTTAPNLPATTLAWHCYDEMFSGCTSLVTAPTLSATTLADNCYDTMFNGCTSLTTAPELPATTLAENCYAHMFSGCTSLVTAPTLPATTLETKCYYEMFSGCTSLVTAPTLPAETLVDWCYNGMFIGCTKLSYIKCLATDISATKCTSYWVRGVASSGTFIKDASMTSWTNGTTGEDGIPTGWTIQNA